jgi:hypothetical protein
MLELQKQLKGKEEILAELTISNRQLVIQCLQLRKGVEATKLYNSVNVDDSTNLHTVVAKAMDHPVEESDIESLLIDESNEDTAREEREAEVMLDCIEKFEELFHGRHFEEAALVAANATKGVLRIPEVLTKFIAVSSDRENESQSPALLYVHALVNSVDAFGPIQASLANQCAEWVLKEGHIMSLSSWITRGKVFHTAKYSQFIGVLLSSVLENEGEVVLVE